MSPKGYEFMRFKKIVYMLVAAIVILPMSSIAAKNNVEIIFSENFEGDLSSWKVDGKTALEKVQLVQYTRSENELYNEYISQFLSIKHDKNYAPVHIKSPIIEVEPMKDYTIAVDATGYGNQKLYVVYLKDDEETYAQIPKIVNVMCTKDWKCTSITITVPYDVTKLQLYLAHEPEVYDAGQGSFDNLIICKGKIGFNKELEKRSIYAPVAEGNSNDLFVNNDVVFYDTFESGLGKWDYDTQYSKGKFKVSNENSYTGIKSLKVIAEYNQKSYGVQSKDFSVIPNSEYKIAYDFINSSGDAPYVYMRFYDAEGKQVHSINVSAKGKNWNVQENSIVAPENAKTARVCIYSGNVTGISYIDNIKVVLTKLGEIKNTKYDEVYKNSLILLIGSPNALVNGKKAFIDKTNHNVVADIVDSRTLVPVRFIAESYGAEVLWDETTRTVTLSLPEKKAVIVLDNKEITINNNIVPIDVPAQIIEGRTMLPLRAFVEEVMDKKVFWDDRGLIVITDTTVLDKDDTETIEKIIKDIN